MVVSINKFSHFLHTAKVVIIWLRSKLRDQRPLSSSLPHMRRRIKSVMLLFTQHMQVGAKLQTGFGRSVAQHMATLQRLGLSAMSSKLSVLLLSRGGKMWMRMCTGQKPACLDSDLCSRKSCVSQLLPHQTQKDILCRFHHPSIERVLTYVWAPGPSSPLSARPDQVKSRLTSLSARESLL
jgi:hypothetical protein